MSRKLVRKIALVLIVVGTILSPITLKPMIYGFGGNKEVVTAHGIIDNKRLVNYECGTSKNRQTCTDYMLSINSKEHSVVSSTFYKHTEGQPITLVTTESNRSAQWWEVLLIALTLLSLCFSGTWVILTLGFFLFWCFFSSSKLTFKEWMDF